MSDFKTSVSLVGDLEEFVNRAKEHVQESIQPVIVEHADKVLKTAQSLVPVDKGTLRDSLHVQQSTGKDFATVRTDARKAPHGHLVHFGTVNMTGRPFLYQAADRHKGELVAALKAAVDKD